MAEAQETLPTLSVSIPRGDPALMSTSSARLGRRTWGGILRVFLAEALFVPTGLLTAAFLTHRLGPGRYGLLSLGLTIVAWVEWSVASVFSRAAIKLVSEAEDWRPVAATLMRGSLIFSIVAALLLGIVIAPLASLLGEPGLTWLLPILALDIPLFNLAQVHRNVLTGLGGFTGRATSCAGRLVVRLLLVLILVGLGLSVTGAALASLGASLAELLICRCYVRPSLSGRAPFSAWRLMSLSAPLFLMAMSLRLFEKLDLVALKALGGTSEQAGYYSAAQNLALLPSLFSLSISPVLLSALGQEVKSGEVGSAKNLARDALRVVVLLIPLSALTAGCAPELTSMIFGSRFAPAATPLSLLIFASSALLMISVTSAILTAVNRANLALALSVPLVPLAIVGHLTAVPTMGPRGAALVTLSGASLGALAQLIAVHRHWGIRPSIPTVCRAAIASIVAAMLAAHWPATGASLFLVKLPAIGLAALITLAALGEFSPEELAAGRALLLGRSTYHRDRVRVP
jgi:O-antigen/teichoic acid export membrane protein